MFPEQGDEFFVEIDFGGGVFLRFRCTENSTWGEFSRPCGTLATANANPPTGGLFSNLPPGEEPKRYSKLASSASWRTKPALQMRLFNTPAKKNRAEWPGILRSN